MSNIFTLIKTLCPNGVEYKALGDVIDYEQPSKYIVGSTKYDDDYKIPVLTAGQRFILGYTNEEFGIYYASNEKPVIIFDDFTTSFHWVNFNFKVKSSALKILTPKKNVDVDFKFIYYAMKCIIYLPKEHARQWISVYSRFQIPLPPIEVQEEIVRILDTFTGLIDNLNEELVLRKKQYEYYRNKLLTPIEKDGKHYLNGKEVEWKTLGEVGALIRGNGLQKSDFTETGVGCIHYGQIYTYYGVFTKKTKSFVTVELAKSLKKVSKGDLILTNTSENVEDICKAVAWLGDEDIVTGGHATILKHNQNSKYLAYLTKTLLFFKEKKKYARGTKVIEISSKDLSKIKIPIPPIEEQERIVKILDKFDALVNDLREGIPAEIEARTKQYEYYRNKLLSFN